MGRRQMARLISLCAIATLSFFLAVTGNGADASEKTNVLVISIDDLNDWVG